VYQEKKNLTSKRTARDETHDWGLKEGEQQKKRGSNTDASLLRAERKNAHPWRRALRENNPRRRQGRGGGIPEGGRET